MENYNEVISFDKNKICEFEKNGIKTIFKKTSEIEFKNLIKAKKFLKDKKILLDGIEYSIDVPDVLSWDEKNQTIHMSFCDGKNMELLLRSENNRKQFLKLFQSIFIFIFKESFYWEDFAPRNILVQDSHISLVDFEKGLSFQNIDVRNFLRRHVYEEYSSFLLPDERLLDVVSVFKATEKEKMEKIAIDSIKIKRIKAIANMISYPPIITREQYLQIQALIVKAETPYLENGHLIFPRLKLESILQDKQINPLAYIEYAREILQSCKVIDNDISLTI